MSPASAIVAATSVETGDNVAQMDASVDGEPIEIAFNVKYMSDVLNVIETPQVALETTSPRNRACSSRLATTTSSTSSCPCTLARCNRLASDENGRSLC